MATASTAKPHTTHDEMLRHRWRLAAGLAAGLVAVAGAGILYAAPNLQYRLAAPENLSGAQLNPPGLWLRPHLGYSGVMAHCGICSHDSPPLNNSRQVRLAWLVSDEDLAGLIYQNVDNGPHTPADARFRGWSGQ